MGSRTVKQPNGLYSRFSEVVDDFTHLNYTYDQMFEVWSILFGEKVAEEKMKNGDENPQRFKEALEIIERIHGDKISNNRLEEMS